MVYIKFVMEYFVNNFYFFIELFLQNNDYWATCSWYYTMIHTIICMYIPIYVVKTFSC